MAKAATLPKVSLDSKFKVGRKSYTMADAIAQGVACYDQLYLIQEDQLNLYRELGNIPVSYTHLTLPTKRIV